MNKKLSVRPGNPSTRISGTRKTRVHKKLTKPGYSRNPITRNILESRVVGFSKNSRNNVTRNRRIIKIKTQFKINNNRNVVTIRFRLEAVEKGIRPVKDESSLV